MPDLLPKLKKIKVDPRKLYLDPNNPRFITKESDRVHEKNYLDEYVISNTGKKMFDNDKDPHDVRQIIKSIEANGWQPVDSIFVQRFDKDRFIVLEGNRRVTAIKIILDPDSEPHPTDELKEQLQEIEVMEIVEKIDGRRKQKSQREVDRKISYLLGVRHHGSLKPWSPFAQAASIYERLLNAAEQTDETFQWDEGHAKEVAKNLSMKWTDVKERVCVYRVMKQISQCDSVKASEGMEGEDNGGMKDRYYSVCKDAVMARSSALSDYIVLDESTFQLNDTSLRRMVELCHFHKKNRLGSPINNPKQWRFFSSILEDENLEEREKCIKRVIDSKEKPEDVWAEREAKIQEPEWPRVLNDLARIFNKLTLADIHLDEESTAVMTTLVELLDQLKDENDE